MRIFLLEDDPEVAASLLAALEMRGHTIVWDTSVNAALETIENGEFTKGIFDLNVGLEKGTTALGYWLHYQNNDACMYSGLPSDAVREMEKMGIENIPVFSKGDPKKLLDWIEDVI